MELGKPLPTEHEAYDAGLIQRFADVPAVDIVRTYYAFEEEGYSGDNPAHDNETSLGRALDSYVAILPEHDLGRAKEIYGTFLDSPSPKERQALGYKLVEGLTKVDHEAGISMWDQLMRDEDGEVRDVAYELLALGLRNAPDDRLARTIGRLTGQETLRGMYAVDTANETELRKITGLSREDAYNLILSYAYAKNQQGIRTVGGTAIRRIMAKDNPSAYPGSPVGTGRALTEQWPDQQV